MTDSEYKKDRRSTVLGCSILIGIAIVLLCVGATLGISIYKSIFH